MRGAQMKWYNTAESDGGTTFRDALRSLFLDHAAMKEVHGAYHLK
jgi:hypothetical protein